MDSRTEPIRAHRLLMQGGSIQHFELEAFYAINRLSNNRCRTSSERKRANQMKTKCRSQGTCKMKHVSLNQCTHQCNNKCKNPCSQCKKLYNPLQQINAATNSNQCNHMQPMQQIQTNATNANQCSKCSMTNTHW